MTETKTRDPMVAVREIYPNSFMHAVTNRTAEGDIEAGSLFLLHAMRGRAHRHHVDEHHPTAVTTYPDLAAPVGAPARAAWLWGYRWQA